MEELQTSLCAIDGEILMDMPLALPRFCVGGLLPSGTEYRGWCAEDRKVLASAGSVCPHCQGRTPSGIWIPSPVQHCILFKDPLHRVQQRLACVTDEAPANAYFATVAGSWRMI